jgi:hypothetical protein
VKLVGAVLVAVATTLGLFVFHIRAVYDADVRYFKELCRAEAMLFLRTGKSPL